MKNRAVIIAAAVTVAIVIVLGIFYWRSTHVQKKKIVIKPRAAAKEVAKKKELPQIQKNYQRPKVVIVMDDFGYTMGNLDALFAAKKPVTFSILPNLTYSKRVAQKALANGYEVILHLPLESLNSAASVEASTIKTGMDEKEVLAILDRDIAGVPGIKGVSNHQGSKATEDSALMGIIMKELKKRNLFFFDSLVTQRSVCRDVARSYGVPYAKRDFFLDNDMSEDAIEKQLLSLRRYAFRKGSAIAVCHDRKNTVAVLKRMMGDLAADGIVFVRLSDMVK